MALIKRGRLSVQPVEEDTWKAVRLLAEKGGWEEDETPKSATNTCAKPRKGMKRGKGTADDDADESQAAQNEKKEVPKSKWPFSYMCALFLVRS